ncbi:hypothetical protein [Rickettsia endosymbiont of Gonocerus acuteangulatus]|uniref:hypothetical protein n=1 Tax=Rickettsia endosymbiont of Gonocerus acuteangulatus TaxID=3066266 RepID=UPI003132BB4E
MSGTLFVLENARNKLSSSSYEVVVVLLFAGLRFLSNLLFAIDEYKMLVLSSELIIVLCFFELISGSVFCLRLRARGSR